MAMQPTGKCPTCGNTITEVSTLPDHGHKPTCTDKSWRPPKAETGGKPAIIKRRGLRRRNK